MTHAPSDGVGLSGQRVFIGDMTDIFGSWVPDGSLDRLFAVVADRSDVTFQILTKRPERMLRYLRSRSWSLDYCWGDECGEPARRR